MVMLVSFRFSFDQFQHSRCGLLGWLKCPFLENFGHSFWAILLGNTFGHMGLWANAHCLGCGFWATKEPRQGPRSDWRGPENRGSVPSGLLRRSAVGFISSGVRWFGGSAIRLLLLRLHRKACFITKSTEPLALSILLPNRKYRLFSAWWVQGIEVRSIVHFFGPALRAPSCRMALCCVLGRSMLVKERAVHFIPDDPVALTFNC